MEDASLKLEAAPLLRTLVAEKIREAIATNRFPPGTRLVERNLIALLGVSRTSVREALRELESEGLVTTEGGRPAVAKLTLAEIRSIYEVRTVLEGLAARLFVRNASEAQLTRLLEETALLLQSYQHYEPGPFLKAKARFYEALFDGSGNDVAASMLRVIHTKVSQLRATSLSVSDRIKASVVEIRALVDAIEQRDEEAAAALTIRHIENACEAAVRGYLVNEEAECRKAG